MNAARSDLVMEWGTRGIFLAVLLAPLAWGCEFSDPQSADSLSVASIEVFPANATTQTGNQSEPVQFTANVNWNTGQVIANAEVAWRSSNQVAGDISADGLFTPSTDNGGITLITATYLGVSTSTTLTSVFVQDLFEDDLPSTLKEEADAATITLAEDKAPFIRYPFDGVVVPRNIEHFEFQWDSPEDRPLTILEFSSLTTHTRVFTTSDRWLPTSLVWETLAATNSGGSFTFKAYAAATIGEGETLRLDGTLASSEQAVEVTISRLDAQGAIYYWSLAREGRDTGIGSIQRIAYGEGQGAEFYAPKINGEESLCVSCHTLTPGGGRMAVVYEEYREAGAGPHSMGLLEVAEGGAFTETVGFGEAPAGARASFSPDEKYVVAIEEGQLLLLDGQTWTYLYPVDLGFRYVVNPSFSPDGMEVVFTAPNSLDENNPDTRFWGGRIAKVSFDDGVFGEPEWLTPQVEGANQYYPVYSPDGAWIVYNQSIEDDAIPFEGDAEMDLSAALYIIARDGGTPIRLDQANNIDFALLGPETDSDSAIPHAERTDPPLVANSWPGWGPMPDADLFWLTFSSIRGFGHDVPFAVPQIWISAIDPARAESGVDPSHRPFWLPFQDADTSNHIPQWGRR